MTLPVLGLVMLYGGIIALGMKAQRLQFRRDVVQRQDEADVQARLERLERLDEDLQVAVQEHADQIRLGNAEIQHLGEEVRRISSDLTVHVVTPLPECVRIITKKHRRMR